jgi:hypothetical protein
MSTPTATGYRWDEPPGALSPRGWLHVGGIVTGFYLDYEAGHYRSPHEYCTPARPCRDCEPGNILCVRYPNGPSTTPRTSRWVQTLDEARQWVESGTMPGELPEPDYQRDASDRYAATHGLDPALLHAAATATLTALGQAGTFDQALAAAGAALIEHRRHCPGAPEVTA